MLERYYALPTTVDRIRALWLGLAIERYAAWLVEHGYSVARGRGCIEILIQFNGFAQSRGAQEWSALPALVDSFVACRTRQRGRRRRDRRARQTLRSMFRSPIEQLLRLAIPDYVGTVRQLAWPFSASAPRFPEYLRGERGLRWPTVQRYADDLRALEGYFAKTGIAKLSELTPRIITEFLTTRGRQIHACQLGGCGSVSRVFLRYLHREQILPKDLSATVPRGRVYRNAGIPRAIPWSDVERTVAGIDRRNPTR